MGCKQSKSTYPKSKEEILAACVNGNVEYLEALVEDNRLARNLEGYKFHDLSDAKRSRCDGFLTYRNRRESEKKAAPGDASSVVAQTRLGQVLWFDEAIAAAARADQEPVVTYILGLNKYIDYKDTISLLLAESNADTDADAIFIPYLIQVIRASTEYFTNFAGVLGRAVAENKPDLLAAVLKAEPEWGVPGDGLDLLTAAKTLPVLQVLLGDARIDVVAREKSIIVNIAEHGTYEMLRAIVADPRVEFGPEIASAAFTASTQGANASVKKLRFIDRRLPEECRNWGYYTLRWGDACKACDVETVRWFLAKLRECVRSSKKRTEVHFRGAVMVGAIVATKHDNAPVLEELLGMTAGGKFIYRGDPLGGHLLKKCCGLPDPSPSALKVLLRSPQIDPAVDDNAAFIAACAAGNVDAAKQLLADPRVDPRAQNSRGAKLASRRGHRGVLQLILADARANPGPTPEYDSGPSKGKEEVAPPPSYAGYEHSSCSYSYYSEE